jgi:hypothetical protein
LADIVVDIGASKYPSLALASLPADGAVMAGVSFSGVVEAVETADMVSPSSA